MLRFHTQDRKKDLKSSSIKAKKDIYINKCLTRKRQNLLYRVRKLKRENNDKIHQCFVRDGQILVRKTNVGCVYYITNENELANFLHDANITESD